jgi:hypothetical protein
VLHIDSDRKHEQIKFHVQKARIRHDHNRIPPTSPLLEMLKYLDLTPQWIRWSARCSPAVRRLGQMH